MAEHEEQTRDDASPPAPSPPVEPAEDGLRRRKLIVLLAAAALCSAYCWRMGFSEDSLHYADIARLIATRGQVATLHLTLNSAGVPDTNLLWPPVYPLLLAGPMRLGATPQLAAALVAILTFAGTLAVMLSVLRRAEWVLLCAIVWLYLITTCGIAYMALSEGPFVLLVTGSLVCLARTMRDDRRKAALIALLGGVLAGAAALTRWIGLLLIVSWPVALLGARLLRRPPNLSWPRVLSSSAAYLLGAGLVVGPWLARNQVVNGMPMGPPRTQSVHTLPSLLTPAARSMYMEFGAVLILLLVVWAIAGRGAPDRRPPESTPTTDGTEIVSYGAVAWASIYTIGLFASLLRYRMGEGPERYLFSAYAALAFAGIIWIDRTRALDIRQRRRLSAIALALVPLLLVPVGRTLEPWAPKERKSALAEWVAANTGPDSLLIGHRIWELHFLTGRPVLESGYPSMPSVIDGQAVTRFLDRFDSHFAGVYLIVDGTEQDEAEQSYQRAGLDLLPLLSQRLEPGAPLDSADCLYVYQVQRPGTQFVNAGPGRRQPPSGSRPLRPSQRLTPPSRPPPARPPTRP